MKNRILFQSFTALTILVSSSAFSDSSLLSFKPQTVRLIPQDMFLPQGFDDNDNGQLVVSGYLPNTCYRAGSANAQVDLEEKKIYVQNTAFVYPGCWCAQVTVPYMHTINLGVLPKGQYQVLVQDQNDISHDRGLLKVAESKTPSPDDFLYAPVQDVFLESSDHSQPVSGQPTLVIRGRFGSDCMHLQEVKVLYRTPHIVEVLPIASVDEDPNCHAGSVPFDTQVKIQSSEKGRTLIYVRSLNGQAVSKVIDL